MRKVFYKERDQGREARSRTKDQGPVTAVLEVLLRLGQEDQRTAVPPSRWTAAVAVEQVQDRSTVVRKAVARSGFLSAARQSWTERLPLMVEMGYKMTREAA